MAAPWIQTAWILALKAGKPHVQFERRTEASAQARIAGILGSAKVNILALNASSAGAMGYIQFVVDNGAKAKKALKGNGISCYEEFVLHTTLPNVPGALAQLAKKLAAKDINIGACYQTTVK